MIIRTRRLVIKPIAEADALDMFTYRAEETICKYQSFHPKNVEEVRCFIVDTSKDFNEENTWFQLGLWVTNKLIGDIGIHFIGPDNQQCEIGYTISPDYQRKGYGKEAVRKIIDYLFTVMSKHRIIASLNPENVASKALLKSLGFREEGCFTKSVLNKGIWEDDLVYAMLREEWKPVCTD
ncbi:MAG: GNAT family N-acetyltransferase [Sphaerochaetaceae bacterium]